MRAWGWPKLIGTLALIAGLVACRGPETQGRTYELEGHVLAIRPEAREILIKHGDIKNFMPAMTMPYKVRDASLLSGKQPGDLVKATLVVAGTDAWLTALDKTGFAALDAPATFPAASFVSPLAPGDRVPTTTLTDSGGQPFSLDAWRDAPFVVTFIYVRCPLPQFCPLMDRRFAELQRAIVADPALAGRARLLSVSFDPDHDTPQALAAHAAKLGADSKHWRFASAPREIVDRFAATFGVNVIREADGSITHNLRTTVVGAGGAVVSVYDGSEWTPDQLLADLRRGLPTR